MSKEPEWFKSYRIKQEKFNQNQLDFNKQVIGRLDNIEKDVKELKTDVAAIKNTPTMKRELNFE